ncbi:hypothetical protein AB6A40_004777 [Gnathostoma spinigerum]|uniref:Uncharacterized protein n=1 Tax=Gnathostoma spinigerum TaxID=75299 RepID=A0ABD6EDJ1_9BILA
MGQTKEVFIHKLICKDTIERVLELQESKLALAKGVLEGAAKKEMNKLTVNDLKYLFDLEKPAIKNFRPASALLPSADF